MPAEHTASGSPQDWLRYARSDLALARSRKQRTMLYEHLCFHAQQVAEKALKAVLVAHGIGFPKTHDLAFLMDALPSRLKVPPSLIVLPSLNRYAVQQRYPGEAAPVTSQDRKRAVQLAEEALDWAEHIIPAKKA